jgi:nitroreductase
VFLFIISAYPFGNSLCCSVTIPGKDKMEKPARTDYPIEETLSRRWSPRAFSDRTVEPDKLRRLFEAARWAPSSFNEQPWSFILTTKEKPEEYAALLNCLVEKNQQWARLAPVLMLSIAKLNFEKTGKPNRHAFHDVGMAVGSLLVEATALGLFVHQMAGFSVAKAREVFSVPAGFEPVAAIALGYAADPQVLPEAFRAQEVGARARKPIGEFVFEGRWGEKSPLAPG